MLTAIFQHSTQSPENLFPPGLCSPCLLVAPLQGPPAAVCSFAAGSHKGVKWQEQVNPFRMLGAGLGRALSTQPCHLPAQTSINKLFNNLLLTCTIIVLLDVSGNLSLLRD